jgi:uncharacterized protein YbjT (DUF2867 family)
VPVVILGAAGPVGKALVPRLVAAGSEVRVVVSRQEASEPLRALGAKVAVGDPSDPELLAAVLRDAHTLCHLVGGLFLAEDEYEPVIVGGTRTAVGAAGEAGIVRLLLLSCPEADPGSANAYLQARGMAEEAVRGSGLDHVVVRSTLVLARGSRWPFFLRRRGQRLAPVFVEDLAAVLAAADDRAQPVSGTFGLQGPDTVTADELAGLLRGGHGRKIGPLRRPRISRAATEVLASDSLADAPDAAAEFGAKLTPLRETLRACGFLPE